MCGFGGETGVFFFFFGFNVLSLLLLFRCSRSVCDHCLLKSPLENTSKVLGFDVVRTFIHMTVVFLEGVLKDGLVFCF